MPAFDDRDPSTWQRRDWNLLQNGAVTLYHRAAILDDDLAWLGANGYRVDRISCATWTTDALLHAGLASALGFPDYYGENLDAFNDCASTLEIAEAGRVLAFERFDVPYKTIVPQGFMILDILEAQARQHLLFGRRLLAMIQTDDPMLSIKPLGGRAPTWNSREWLTAKRTP